MNSGLLRHVLVSGVIISIITALLYLALLTDNSLDSVTHFGWVLAALSKRL